MSKYASDKPKECTLCSFWNKNKNKCGLDSCYYLLEEPEKAPSPCLGCPYGKGRGVCFPCYRKLLGQEVKFSG